MFYPLGKNLEPPPPPPLLARPRVKQEIKKQNFEKLNVYQRAVSCIRLAVCKHAVFSVNSVQPIKSKLHQTAWSVLGERGRGGRGQGLKPPNTRSVLNVHVESMVHVPIISCPLMLNLQRILMGQSPCRNGTSERLRSVQSLELCLYIFYQCATFCLDFLCICLFVFFLQDSF